MLIHLSAIKLSKTLTFTIPTSFVVLYTVIITSFTVHKNITTCPTLYELYTSYMCNSDVFVVSSDGLLTNI